MVIHDRRLGIYPAFYLRILKWNGLGRTRPKGGSSLGGKITANGFNSNLWGNQSWPDGFRHPLYKSNHHTCLLFFAVFVWHLTIELIQAIPPAATRKLKLFHKEKKGTNPFWRCAGSWFSTQGIRSCHFVLTGLFFSGNSLCFLLWCVWKGGMVNEWVGIVMVYEEYLFKEHFGSAVFMPPPITGPSMLGCSKISIDWTPAPFREKMP